MLPSIEKHLVMNNQGPRKQGKRWGIRLAQMLTATVMLLAMMLTFSATQPAHASSSCYYPFCSETYNKSLYSVLVAHDWCGNSETLYQDAPPCGWSSRTDILYTNEHTPSHEDWDVLRIDRGWRYTVQVYSEIWGWSSVGSFDNRHGSTQMWVRVHNNQTMYVLRQCYTC